MTPPAGNNRRSGQKGKLRIATDSSFLPQPEQSIKVRVSYNTFVSDGRRFLKASCVTSDQLHPWRAALGPALGPRSNLWDMTPLDFP